MRGYSQYIHFIQPPTTSYTRKCDSQAVLKIDLSGPYKGAKFILNYADRPRLWTLDISDSPTGDGYGGDNGTTSNMAETHIFNKQMRIYGNNLPGFLDATINGPGLLMKVVDNVVKRGSKLTIDITDEKIEWAHGGKKNYIESRFLYTLQSQNTTYGDVENNLYAGFNRVVAGSYRSGSGLCTAQITLYQGSTSKLTLCHIFLIVMHDFINHLFSCSQICYSAL